MLVIADVLMCIESTLGGFPMNDRTCKMNNLLNNEALLASFLGLFILTKPVVKGDALRL
jgi:hypothetical protein